MSCPGNRFFLPIPVRTLCTGIVDLGLMALRMNLLENSGFTSVDDPSPKCTVNHLFCLLHSSALGQETKATRVSCNCRGYTTWEAAEKPSPQPSKTVLQTRPSHFTLFPHCPSTSSSRCPWTSADPQAIPIEKGASES